MGGGISKHEDEVKKNDIASASMQSSTISSKSNTTTSTSTTTEESSSKPSEQSSSSSSSGCPMHKADGSYSYNLSSMLKAFWMHNPKGNKPLSQDEQDKALKFVKESKEKSGTNDGSDGCPVAHHGNKKSFSASPPSECPVSASSSSSSHPEYNVYSQVIDKTNQMPTGIRTQLPSAIQSSELSTHRVSSTIPKGGGDNNNNNDNKTTWTYPSPQQFYNSLVRKGKLGDDTSEDDMEIVVALHNNMNEKTWKQVVEWEQQIYNNSNIPKLLRFQGRPHDLSPKARLKHYILNHPLPFDRHDWTVLRDDGSTIRYVIDYYYDESGTGSNIGGRLQNDNDDENLSSGSRSLLVDVRPALDGPQQLFHRAITMPYKIYTSQTTFQPLPLRGSSELNNQIQESIEVWKSIQKSVEPCTSDEDNTTTTKTTTSTKLSESEAIELATNFAKVLSDCRTIQNNIASCKTEEECAKASMNLTVCVGALVCPVQHKGLLDQINNINNVDETTQEHKIEAALETLTDCIAYKTSQRQDAIEQYPKLFESSSN